MGPILPGNVLSTWSLPYLLIFLQKAQHIDRFNQLFIPINGGRCHWYSACIDYVRKRIDIYDSLQEFCVSNRSKPADERQNANLMLVSASFSSILYQSDMFLSLRSLSLLLYAPDMRF